MKPNQKGFSFVEILIVIFIVGLIGVAGWFSLQNRDDEQVNNTTNPSSTTNQTADSRSETTAFTDCHTEIDKDANFYDDGLAVYEWITVEHTKVVLSGWNMTLTLPESTVGKAVCRGTGDAYEFSTKAVINDSKCVSYYRNEELLSEAVQLMKYSETTAAEGQINLATGTLEDYYKAHKAANGNYFTEPNSGRNYYKVGDSFYVAFGDATGALDRHKASRAAACKDERPDFTQPFVDAMASLEQQ